MVEQSFEWNKESIRTLRLRLGWSKSDIARRLKCSLQDIEIFEEGETSAQELTPEQAQVQSQIRSELEVMYRQCQECADEVKYTPLSELALDKDALEQIDFSRVKANLE